METTFCGLRYCGKREARGNLETTARSVLLHGLPPHILPGMESTRLRRSAGVCCRRSCLQVVTLPLRLNLPISGNAKRDQVSHERGKNPGEGELSGENLLPMVDEGQKRSNYQSRLC